MKAIKIDFNKKMQNMSYFTQTDKIFADSFDGFKIRFRLFLCKTSTIAFFHVWTKGVVTLNNVPPWFGQNIRLI